MNQTIIGVFDTQTSALQARQELLSAGFAQSDVTTLPAEGTATGTTSAASTASSAAPAHEGGVSGFFKSLFGMDERDEHVGVYSTAVQQGGYMVSVNTHNDAQLQQAEQILQRCGAVDIDERAEQWRTAGATGTAGAVSAGTLGTAASGLTANDARATIPVVQEELQVGKRAVQRGGVRVFTRVVETPVEETVRLREEHATIERHAVDRPATQADFAALAAGGTIEVRETAEEAVVGKTARVTEEIEVGKQVTEHTETVRDTVRHTDVQVEQLGTDATTTTGTTGTTSTAGTMGTTGKTGKPL